MQSFFVLSYLLASVVSVSAPGGIIFYAFTVLAPGAFFLAVTLLAPGVGFFSRFTVFCARRFVMSAPYCLNKGYYV